MASVKKELQNYLKVILMMTGGAISAAVPLLNLIVPFVHVPPGKEGLFGVFGTLFGVFPITWVFASRETILDWHTGVLALKSKLRKIDQRIYELAHDPVANRGELESLEAKSRNTMNAMAVSEARGGIFRIQALSLSLFGLAALCLVAYFWLYPSWAFGLSLATYSFAFTGLSGAFSVATVAVLGRAKHSRRY